MTHEFLPFPKIARLHRDIVITEKLDGTNAQIYITDDNEMLIGSRTRWITPDNDNYGFARWAMTNEEELRKLGPGQHFGEWWGKGIQRGYNLAEKRFSLFNVARWGDPEVRPKCCHVVPTLYKGPWSGTKAGIHRLTLALLAHGGSLASPGFMKPEGVVIWHEASRQMFKITIEGDEVPKGISNEQS